IILVYMLEMCISAMLRSFIVMGVFTCLKLYVDFARMLQNDESVSRYQLVLLLSPIVSVLDCIIRKRRANIEPAKLQHVKKGKKKQAEKKRRRLDKALAASAAIRSELEYTLNLRRRNR
ncbi:hypothetical protein AKJ16_DCAP14384, partial [Drosera capensis]